MQPQSRSRSPLAGLALPAAAAAATATSSASSNTQHSNRVTHHSNKRPLLDHHITRCKRPRHAVAAAAAAWTAASSGSSSSLDDTEDTAVSSANLLTVGEAKQLYADVLAGQQSLQGVLLQMLHCRGERAFIAFLRYVLLQQQQQQQQDNKDRTVEVQTLRQQQQQQGGSGLLYALLADNCSLLRELMQTLSHHDIVTCYNAAMAFQGLADLVGAQQLLAAVLAVPHGVLLLLEALNESRLRMAYQQGFVITVCYSGRAVKEPLCSGTVGCMIKCARKQDLQELIKQLLPVLSWQDESAVAAAMSLVIIARNADAGFELLLPHIPQLVAAVQQQWSVSKRVLLALRCMAESAAAAAAASSGTVSSAVASKGASPAAAAAAAMADAGLIPLVKLVLHGTPESATLAGDIIRLLTKSVPDHPGLLNCIPDLAQGDQQLEPISMHAAQAVQILQQITAGSTTGSTAAAATVQPCVDSFLAAQNCDGSTG